MKPVLSKIRTKIRLFANLIEKEWEQVLKDFGAAGYTDLIVSPIPMVIGEHIRELSLVLTILS